MYAYFTTAKQLKKTKVGKECFGCIFEILESRVLESVDDYVCNQKARILIPIPITNEITDSDFHFHLE